MYPIAMRGYCLFPAFGVLLVVLGACIHPISAQTVLPSGLQGYPSPWLNPLQESAIDQIFSRPSTSPGYAVALIKDGEFVFAKGYGLANLDDDIPITPETSVQAK
jgi:CubicO group peptidase (beta-lactamase class C family)